MEAIPSKLVLESIIRDYDVPKALCELIDNAIDEWKKGGKRRKLSVKVELDVGQQAIFVEDNAGGVDEDDLVTLVGPGHTTNKPSESTIGVFGVGSKRAAVVLAQDVKFTTRRKSGSTFRVEYDDDWLKDNSWTLPYYEVDAITPASTKVELNRLRLRLEMKHIEELRRHISEVYAEFLGTADVEVLVNGVVLSPIRFDDWAFPPDYGPKRIVGEVMDEDGRVVKVEITAGLTRQPNHDTGAYGCYLYCNGRLVAKGVRDDTVGFVPRLVGKPHRDVSLVRVIVKLGGPAFAMPWTSTKSGINQSNQVFRAIRGRIVEALHDYGRISRGWKKEWPLKVFRFDKGRVARSKVTKFEAVGRSYLVQLPTFRRRTEDKLRLRNAAVLEKKPWARGLADGVVAAEYIRRKPGLDAGNRIALVVLDSTLEIAFKEFLVNESGGTYNDKRLLELFQNRKAVQDEIKTHRRFPKAVLPAFLWVESGPVGSPRCQKTPHEREEEEATRWGAGWAHPA